MSHYLLAVYRPEAALDWATVFSAIDDVTERMRAANELVYSGFLMPKAQGWVTDVAGGRGEPLSGTEVLNTIWVIDVSDAATAESWAQAVAVATRCQVEVRPFQQW